MDINKMELVFMDRGGRTIAKKKLTGLAMKESGVIARSIEFYQDPEPCMIHRSAVMKTMYLEIFGYFEELLKQNVHQQQWINVPDNLKKLLEISTDVDCVLIISNESGRLVPPNTTY